MADKEQSVSRADRYPNKSWIWYAAVRTDPETLDVDIKDVLAVLVCEIKNGQVDFDFTADPTLPPERVEELQRVSEDLVFDELAELGITPSDEGLVPWEEAMEASRPLWGSYVSLAPRWYSTLSRYLDKKQRDKIRLVFRRWGALKESSGDGT